MSRLFSVDGKVVIVTGSNRGNGYAIAKGLMDAGAKVIRIDIELTSELATDDFEFDLSHLSEIGDLVENITAKHERIDALVNNAGVSISSRNPYDDLEAYQQTLAVNLHATFILCSRLCPIIAIGGNGAIVNITSLGADLGFPNNPSYQVSKAGIKQLTKALARDWGAKGLRVNNVCPGYMKTAMTEKSFNDSTLNKERRSRTILDRWGEPSDLVGAVIFLISRASSYITGSDIYVDGGWTAKGL